MHRLFTITKEILQNAVTTCLTLFKVMIPIIIVVKIMTELDLIQYLGMVLEPFMALAGLPGETALVWASAMLGTTYSGMIVYVSLLPHMEPLSVAQITVLCSMIMVAHGLPIECRVAQQCGVSFRSQFLFRVCGAMMLGIILHLIYMGTNTLQGPSAVLWNPTMPDPGILNWAISEAKNLGYIFLIILSLMIFMRLLDALRVTEGINYLLRPLLKFMGIGSSAATITVIGLTMGMTYGCGLVIPEAKSGKIPLRDVFASLTLMGLCHAIIEDTLGMLLLGAHLSGILWGRLLFSLVFVAILMRVFDRFQKIPSSEPGV